jgi:hypothetical protein
VLAKLLLAEEPPSAEFAEAAPAQEVSMAATISARRRTRKRQKVVFRWSRIEALALMRRMSSLPAVLLGGSNKAGCPRFAEQS